MIKSVRHRRFAAVLFYENQSVEMRIRDGAHIKDKKA